MLSDVSPKRRWLLAAVAVGVVAAAIGFVFLPEDPEDDLPRLVILRREKEYKQEAVLFRFDAPRHRRAWIVEMSTQNPSTGPDRKAMLQVAGHTPDVDCPVIALGEFAVKPPLGVKATQSTEFGILPPVDGVWRLRCQVVLRPVSRLKSLWIRVRFFWQTKSLDALRWPMRLGPTTFVDIESDLITNALPKAADAPRP